MCYQLCSGLKEAWDGLVPEDLHQGARDAARSNPGWCALWVLDQALKRTSCFTELSAGFVHGAGINAPVGEEASKKQCKKRRNHTYGCRDGARNCGFQPRFVKKRG